MSNMEKFDMIPFYGIHILYMGCCQCKGHTNNKRGSHFSNVIGEFDLIFPKIFEC